MKIRMTVIMENDKERPEELTPSMVARAWDNVLKGVMAKSDDPSEYAYVEEVEFVKD